MHFLGVNLLIQAFQECFKGINMTLHDTLLTPLNSLYMTNAFLRNMHFQLVNKNRFLEVRSLRHVPHTIFTVFCIRLTINSTIWTCTMFIWD